MQIISLTFFSSYAFSFHYSRFRSFMGYSFGLTQSPSPSFHILFESNYYLFNDITHSSAIYSILFSFSSFSLIILHNHWAHSGLKIDCLASHFEAGPEYSNLLLSLLRSLYFRGSRFFIQLIELRDFSFHFFFFRLKFSFIARFS